ncbi:MAG: rhomboid family intramembrane serine protease [Alloprevotella sp.]|nr:rhomboid family intramembrane serine protease [Alloprevotella sp.]
MPNILQQMPPATKNLIIINCIVLLAQIVCRMLGINLAHIFGLNFILAGNFHFWQVVSYMFLHGNFTHLFFNMFALWMFGIVIEQTLGTRKFLILYFVSGIGAAFCQELWQLTQYILEGLANYQTVRFEDGTIMDMPSYLNSWTTIGASGACYGILLAFGFTYPNERIMLLIPPIPMKAKYFVFIYALIELVSAIFSNGNIAHMAHLGGMLFSWFILRHWKKQAQRAPYTNRPRYYNEPEKEGLWSRLKHRFERMDGYEIKENPSVRQRENDVDYNRRQKEREERLDKILDKVKESGYESLTREEKEELFNNSRD